MTAHGVPAGVPFWAEADAERLAADVPGLTWHTAQSHERVLARQEDGTVWIINRGRGLNSLTAAEAQGLALFLLGADPEGVVTTHEYGVRYPVGAYIRITGTGSHGEEVAYEIGERKPEVDLVRRARLDVPTGWEVMG